MKLRTTIKLKIPKRRELLNLMKKYSKAVSYIANQGFKSKVYNRYKLHHLCYYKARKKFNLPSQFVINANRVASQTLKSVKTNNGSKPVFKEYLPLAFDKRTFTFSFEKVSLASLKPRQRIKIPIEIPEYYWKYLDWSPQTALLILDRKDRLFLHITFSRKVNAPMSDGNILGVDLGINHIAVTSNKQFFSGSKIKKYRLKFKRLRARLQSKGTRSAQKLLKKISGKERRFKAYWNHVISKQIVNTNAGTIVFENLKGIRRMRKGRRLNFWLNGWSFYQLQQFTSYKALRKGIRVIKVNPYMTSQICSKCGHIGSRSKGFFYCSHCGYSLNSDLNASYNLAKQHSMSDAVLGDVTHPNIQSDDVKGTVGATATELMDNQSPKAKSPLL